MEEKRLDFRQNQVQVLTLEELAQTAHEDYHNGLPVMGIYHWQLIDVLLESLEKANVKYEVQEIFAANNNSKDRPGVTIERRIAEEKGGNVLEAYTLRRVYANINLFDPCADDWQMNMAVAYHQSICSRASGFWIRELPQGSMQERFTRIINGGRKP